MSRVFNLSLSRFSRLNLIESSDFKLMSRKFVKSILEYGDYDFFFRGIAQDAGFSSEIVLFKEGRRQFGKSRWTGIKLLRYAFNIIISFTRFPLYLILFMGVISIIFAILLLIITVISFFHGVTPGGYPTIVIVGLMSLGLIMISIGIIGVYLSKIYDEVKGRPRYLIRSKTGIQQQNEH